MICCDGIGVRMVRFLGIRIWLNAAIFFGFTAEVSCASDMSLELIGQQVIPHNGSYEGTVVGGLSAIDYDPETGRFIVLSDDRSKKNPARFYQMTLDYDLSGFHAWHFTDMQTIKRPDGSVFPEPGLFGKSIIDPEALRLSPNNHSLYWASEGNRDKGVNAFIREMTREGRYIRDFQLPGKYLIGRERGIRNNLAFEGMALHPDKKSIFTAMEGPLIQDGEEANVSHGAMVRFLELSIKSGHAIHEYAYPVEPVYKENLPIGNLSVNGVSEILSIGGGRYFVIERSFSSGAGLSIRFYLADFSQATDILSLDSLKNADYRPAKKTLLLNLSQLNDEFDNIEAISFGKDLADGRRSLIMVSDNNFNLLQTTQIWVFAVNGGQGTVKTQPQPH